MIFGSHLYKRIHPIRWVATAITLLALTAWTIPAGAQNLKEVLDAVRSHYQGMTDLEADYTRVTKSPAMDSLFKSPSAQTASGRLWFKKPGYLRLEQSKPRPETLVTDGSAIWWYIPEEREAQKYTGADLFTELKPLIDFLSGLDRLSQSFDVSLGQAKEGGATDEYALNLAPKTQGVGPQRISVRFAARDFSLLGFQFVSVLGETTNFVLSGVRLDTGIPAERFTFHPPTGTKVVENPEP